MDYGITNNSNILFGLRFHGGASTFKRELVFDEKCMITHEDSENGVEVFKMTCGHAISCDGLMDYVWNEVKMKSEIACPLCSKEWTIQAIKFYGEVQQDEYENLEMGISRNYCTNSQDINQCPVCNTYCTRLDPDNNCVKCMHYLFKKQIIQLPFLLVLPERVAGITFILLLRQLWL